MVTKHSPGFTTLLVFLKKGFRCGGVCQLPQVVRLFKKWVAGIHLQISQSLLQITRSSRSYDHCRSHYSPRSASWECAPSWPRVEGIRMTKHSPCFIGCLVMYTQGPLGLFLRIPLIGNQTAGTSVWIFPGFGTSKSLHRFVCTCVDSDGRSLDLLIADHTTVGDVPQGGKARRSREKNDKAQAWLWSDIPT